MIFRGKQVLHSRKRQDLLTLCAYAVIENHEDGIYAGRIDEKEGLLFPVENKDGLFEFLRGLRDGMEQEAFLEGLSEFFPEEGAEEFSEQLIQAGVLE